MLSVCLIVRDEESVLGRCLRSLDGVADEIIVVDTGSDDQTLKIAEEAGASTHQFAWTDDFSEARNFSIQQAQHEWILVIDADEYLEESEGQELSTLIEAAKGDAFRIVVRNLLPGGDLLSHQDLRLTRLFRNRPEYRYEGRIHEQVSDSILRSGGKIVDADLVLVHSGYQDLDVQGGQNRASRNLDLLKKALNGDSEDAYLWYQLGNTLKALRGDDAAVMAYENCLNLGSETLGGPIVSEVCTKLGQIFLSRDNWPQSNRYARHALKFDSNAPIPLQVLAVSLISSGAAREAIPYLQALISHPAIRDEHRSDFERMEQILSGAVSG